ncbi:TPM domain-containing protein [Cellulophaga sp. E16_2]|uniref:TPM domain-containing protein n=1 Tax=Cellulophaga sp. E16_2 TaxID=2789297 RepID=UPI001A92F4BE|nr:TPM domain-containing protein [Cellulophaga sp. E16_2]MBO0592961.1 TPM domain-containing protein [Cellulophaga sp. E16_2]
MQNIRIASKLLLLFLALNVFSYKAAAQETETGNPTPEYDFSEIEKSPFPEPIGIVNDYGQVFTESQRSELYTLLYDYESETNRQIVVVTIERLTPYDNIQEYGTDLGQAWGVGSTDRNNGMVIIICKPCRQIGIATGSGTREVLTDRICNEIITNTIVPEFKNGNFYDGIKIGLNELITNWE